MSFSTPPRISTTRGTSSADKVSTIYMALAGFDPTQAYLIWQRATAKFPVSARDTNYLYDHPLNDERARMVREFGEKAKQYFVGPGRTNPAWQSVLKSNALFTYRTPTESGGVELLQATADSLKQHVDTIQEERKRTQEKAQDERKRMQEKVQVEISWPQRAAEAVRTAFSGNNGQTHATNIQRITHPTGTGPSLASVQCTPAGTSLLVTFTVNWSGGLSGAGYTTVVSWLFDRTGHKSAVIRSDNANFATSAENAQRLDAYFRDSLFPVIQQNVK